jgi:hypothetical protein
VLTRKRVVVFKLPARGKSLPAEVSHIVLGGTQGAIKTISNMVTISIQPFAAKKIFLLVAAIICLSSAACFADPVFMNVRSASSQEIRSSGVSKTAEQVQRSAPSDCSPNASAVYNLTDLDGAANVRLA